MTTSPTPDDSEHRTVGGILGQGALSYWTAVIVATLIAIVSYVTLNVIGIAAGFAAIDPIPSDSSMGPSSLPLAIGFWWLGSTVVSLFVAGFILGWLQLRPAGKGLRAGPAAAMSALIHGGTVWALAALMMAWLATTVIGSVVGGAFGLFMNTANQPTKAVEVVVRSDNQALLNETSSTNNDASSQSRPPSVARGETSTGSGGVVSGLETLTWMAVLEAARQLRDPEVRAMVRRYALAGWESTQDLRERLSAQIDDWVTIAANGGSQTAQALNRTIEEILLLTPEDAERLIETWKRKLEAAVRELGRDSSSPAAPSSQSEVGGREDDTQWLIILRDAAVKSVEDLWATLSNVIQAGGKLDAEAREQALLQIEKTFEASRQQASQILERWERQAQSAAAELGEMTDDVRETSLKQADAALAYLSMVAMWLAGSLLFGWLAASAGAYSATRIAELEDARRSN